MDEGDRPRDHPPLPRRPARSARRSCGCTGCCASTSTLRTARGCPPTIPGCARSAPSPTPAAQCWKGSRSPRPRPPRPSSRFLRPHRSPCVSGLADPPGDRRGSAPGPWPGRMLHGGVVTLGFAHRREAGSAGGSAPTPARCPVARAALAAEAKAAPSASFAAAPFPVGAPRTHLQHRGAGRPSPAAGDHAMTHPAPSSAPVSPSVAETMRRFQIDETLARPVAAGRLVDAVPFVLNPDQPPEWAAVTLDVEGIELVLAAGLCDLSRCWETDLRHRPDRRGPGHLARGRRRLGRSPLRGTRAVALPPRGASQGDRRADPRGLRQDLGRCLVVL